MSNFQISFSNPLLLLLLIPAVLLTLLPYFLVSKKYRRNRNRVTSVVLHMLIMVLSISLLAGIGFSYQVPNKQNEILLVVDLSYSSELSEGKKNQFVQSVIEEKGSAMKLGVVTFGYNQVYAVELTYDSDKVYDQYLKAARPDDSATDIASALEFASNLFTYPDNGKIVLITDGAETDRRASSVIRSIAASGIKIDTAFFPSEKAGSEVQLVGATFPEERIAVDNTFEIGLSLRSNYAGPATVSLLDNGTESQPVKLELKAGEQTVSLQHTVSMQGLHELSFVIKSDKNEDLQINNVFYSYLYLEIFDDILIVERTDGESSRLRELLPDTYHVTVVNVSGDEMPDTLDKLRQFDQVILVNIANSDMPEGFDQILNTYVYELGGGLFTVGGNKTDASGETVANTYNRKDLENTLYQQMLPVQAVDYTPPVGVMIIIDRSGSMDATDPETGKTRLQLAKDGALACLEALTERDWCGVMTLETTYNEEVAITPLPQLSKIEAAIDSIEIGGGTNYTGAIERAGAALSALRSVQRRHIILVSDAEPGDPLWGDPVAQTGGYGGAIKHYYESAGITCSIVSISGSSGQNANMQTAADVGHGKFYNVTNVSLLPDMMAGDLKVPEIKEYNPEPFTPKITDHTSVVNGILQADMPELGGYYGTKLKDGATVPLMADYVPVYAQWNYGKGSVGSFMCDLNGTWSSALLQSSVGEKLINNIVNALFPKENIRPQDISAAMEEDNYSTQLSIFTSMKEGETIEVTITGTSEQGDEAKQIVRPSPEDGFSRVSFTIRQPGVHKVLIEKKDSAGKVISSYTTYRTFSYSAEYDMFVDSEQCKLYLTELAKSGNGTYVTEPWEVYEDFVRTLKRSFDPRFLFIILAIVLFLLDVAVRKFKFKWPHEIFRDYKAKKELMQGKGGVSKL